MSGVRPKVVPEGLNHIRDGCVDSVSHESVFIGRLVEVVSDAECEGAENEVSLLYCE